MPLFSSDKRTTGQILEALKKLWAELPFRQTQFQDIRYNARDFERDETMAYNTIKKNRNASAQEKQAAKDLLTVVAKERKKWHRRAKGLKEHKNQIAWDIAREEENYRKAHYKETGQWITVEQIPGRPAAPPAYEDLE